MQSLESVIISLDLSSWENRRKVIRPVVGLLERLRTAEEIYVLSRQSSDAYNFVEYSISQLDEAIGVLGSVYDKTKFILGREFDML